MSYPSPFPLRRLTHADLTTVNQCAYELGILAEIQVAEAIEMNNNLNIVSCQY